MATKLYEISGDFTFLFPLEEGQYRNTYEEINAMNDIARNALEKDHIKVKKINVRIIQESKEA